MKKYTVTNDKCNQNYIIIYNKDGSVNRIKIIKNIFNDKNVSISKIIQQNIKKYIGKHSLILENGQKIYFGKDLLGEYVYSNATKNLTIKNKLAKGRASIVLNEIINNAIKRSWEPNKKNKHKIDAKYGFYRYSTNFSFEFNGIEQIYNAIVLIRNDKNGKKYLYDILNIKKIGINLPLVVSN